MQKKFRDLVYDFAKEAAEVEDIVQIILFGSVAKEEADERSDVDFFIVLDKKNRKIQKQVQDIAYALEKRYDRSVQLTFSGRSLEGVDASFLEDVFGNGLVVFSREMVLKVRNLRLDPLAVFSFSMNNLSQADKMRVKRALYGGESHSSYKEKVYRTQAAGLIPKENRLGKGAFIAERSKSRTIEEIFKKFGVNHKKTDVWMSR